MGVADFSIIKERALPGGYWRKHSRRRAWAYCKRMNPGSAGGLAAK